jgi:riboflavin synthase
MFTGLVEAIGIVERVEDRKGSRRFRIKASALARGMRIGASIAVNGCCLTVEERIPSGFRVTAVEETLSKTNLGKLSAGSHVNLERPMAADGRLGGHFVLGHVDCTTTVKDVKSLGTGRMVTFALPKRFRHLVIPVGSIAVDGVSLTVARLAADTFTVAIIPHTWEHTLFGEYGKGTRVNLEFDMIGKYVARFRGK